MPDPILHPTRIKVKVPGPLILEASRNSLLGSRLTDIPSGDLIIVMGIEVVDEHVRGDGDPDLEIGVLLVAEREGFVALALHRDEDGRPDRVAVPVQVGRALAEVAHGRALAVAGSRVALRLHQAGVAGGPRGFIVWDVWCVRQGTAGSTTR